MVGDEELFVVNPHVAINIDAHATALSSFLEHDPPFAVSRLPGDEEKAFKTKDRRINQIYKSHNIKFEGVGRIQLNTKLKVKDAPYHTALSVMDRVVRTIRDMLYNTRTDVNPKIMTELVKQYNSAPHDTLTKYGPGFPISPDIAQSDPNLIHYINRKLTQTNMLTKSTPEFILKPGTRRTVLASYSSFDKKRSKVWDEAFVVVSFEHGRSQLRGVRSDRAVTVPRSQIHPEVMNSPF
jgi:hypothetical protein